MKLTSATVFVYILLLVAGLYFGYRGDVLSHQWEFNYEQATLYLGSSILAKNEVDALYIVWLLMFTLSIVHIFKKSRENTKSSLILGFLLACIFFVFPKITLFVIVGPTIIVNQLLTIIDNSMLSRVLLIASVMLQAALVPILLEKTHSFLLRRNPGVSDD